jgi:hypothetical protein
LSPCIFAKNPLEAKAILLRHSFIYFPNGLLPLAFTEKGEKPKECPFHPCNNAAVTQECATYNLLK